MYDGAGTSPSLWERSLSSLGLEGERVEEGLRHELVVRRLLELVVRL